MLRLLKYELKKTLLAKLILLGITLLAQAVFLIGFWGKKDIPLVLGSVMLFFIAISGIALMGILSLITLHRDMNTKLGYLLFMTPNSCYRILGAKVIECGLSLLLAGGFFFGLGYLDFSLLLGEGTNKQIWEMVNEVLQAVNNQIVVDVPHVSALVFNMLASWLCTITTAYLSDVVCTALLSGKKANWLATFALFILLNYAITKLLWLVPSSIGVIPVLLWQAVIALVLSVVMYVVSARLMDKYLSV